MCVNIVHAPTASLYNQPLCQMEPRWRLYMRSTSNSLPVTSEILYTASCSMGTQHTRQVTIDPSNAHKEPHFCARLKECLRVLNKK